MPIYMMGDVHGHYATLTGLLQREYLLDEQLRWSGGDSTLCFVGDYVDRGSEGIAVIDLVMRLQTEAANAGGQVIALIGNHDVTMLAAHRFGEMPASGPGKTFYKAWQRNGGQQKDMDKLMPEHIEWLSNLPAMIHLEDKLILHADAMLYVRYGESIEEVNAAFSNLLHTDDDKAWDSMIEAFAEHRAFMDKMQGTERALEMLGVFGGEQIIHGHSTIGNSISKAARTVTEAYLYNGGLCVDIDGGIYEGGTGFLYPLPMEMPVYYV